MRLLPDRRSLRGRYSIYHAHKRLDILQVSEKEDNLNISEFIEKSLTESKEYINQAINDLSIEELAFQPQPHSNCIAFLLWHLARVEDLWINRVILGGQEIYESDGWYQKFGTAERDLGFGYDVDKLNSWPVPSLELLQEYRDAVQQSAFQPKR